MGEQNELEISKSKELSTIDTTKFKNMVTAIGPETIQAVATSGPQMQVSGLCGGTCVRDGHAVHLGMGETLISF